MEPNIKGPGAIYDASMKLRKKEAKRLEKAKLMYKLRNPAPDKNKLIEAILPGT